MKSEIKISYGHYGHKGLKKIYQDYYDIKIPKEPLLSTKGIALGMADGISSSDISQEASKVSIQTFLEDYYCTSEAWSVRNSATKVITAINSWLYSQNKKNQYHYEKDRGFVCTFSSIIFKSTTAHILHLGDIRVYKFRDKSLKQLTTDHRTWISKDKSYLSRALGIDSVVNVDYCFSTLKENDIFLIMSDGVYEFIDENILIEKLENIKNFDDTAKQIVDLAIENRSDDNVSIQIIKIDKLPTKQVNEIKNEIFEKPVPKVLTQGELFDGFKIIEILQSSSRSFVYLARDEQSKQKVVIKAPSYEYKEDTAYLERLLMEEWIAKRVNNKHILKAYDLNREKNYLYIVTNYVKGQTLTQWMRDNPKLSLQEIRPIVKQIATALQAFHRYEMLYQDLRPENILINEDNQITIIDFGSTKVAGILEIDSFTKQENLQGTALYSAPEYFLGFSGTNSSDIFSLAVIVYQMLSGKFPYDTNIARTSTKTEQNKLQYTSLLHRNIKVPLWFDETLKKALSIEPKNRYSELSEFIYDLEYPNEKFVHKVALMEKDPVLFWKCLALILFLINILFIII